MPTRLATVGVADRIERAIVDGELFVEYQPIVDRVGQLVGHEALVRWEHPRLGVVQPGDFIPHIESLPVIEPLTWWVSGTVISQAAIWREQGRCAAVSLNVSPALLPRVELARTLAGQLARCGLPASLLTVELTETATAGVPAAAAKALHELGDLGVRRSIDDFGAGCTSLALLKTYASVLDELKIDGSFVRDIPTSPVTQVIVETLCQLGHRLGLSVVGEGVESDRIAAALVAIGCDHLQGHHVGRPGQPW